MTKTLELKRKNIIDSDGDKFISYKDNQGILKFEKFSMIKTDLNYEEFKKIAIDSEQFWANVQPIS